jgi:hypothetical protein
MTWNDHDHRGQYADERHDHDGDYAEKHHRHYDDESAVRGLREDLGHAEERIGELEDAARQWRQEAEERIRALDGDLRGALAFIRVLDRLRPTCVICLDATADRQTAGGPACTDCVGDLPGDGTGPDPDRPETWAFPDAEEGRPGEPEDICPETSDGYHCTHWQEGLSHCCACGSEPESPEHDDDPDEPANRELEPDPPGWYDVPALEEDR